MNWYVIKTLAFFPPKQKVNPGAMLGVLSTGRISLLYCPSGMPHKGAILLQLSTLE
jgi:hypothetical protein